MSIQDHGPSLSAKERRFRARRNQIIDVALTIAESEGWDAVTTRRVAQRIDYSPPVIYQHFDSRDGLLRAIALDGFTALDDEIRAVAATQTPSGLEGICRAYLEFAKRHPARYVAMFSLPTSITFDATDTPPAPQQAFGSLRLLIAKHHPCQDPDAAAEFFWAACHGLASLAAAGRIPDDRLETHIANVGRLLPRKREQTPPDGRPTIDAL